MEKWKNTATSIIMTFIVGYFFGSTGLLVQFSLLVFVFYFKDRLIYITRVPRWIYSPIDNPKCIKDPKQINLQAENVEITTEDGIKLKGLFVSNPNSKQIIVYLHGNVVELWWRIFMMKYLTTQTDSDVLIVAYRGYSDNEGKPSERGLKLDARAVMNFIITFKSKQRSEGREKQVFLYGASLGGALAIYLANTIQFKYEIRGIMLENTFSSMDQVIMDKLIYVFPFLPLFLKNEWNSSELIPHVKVPIMFIRSLKDQVVYPYHMEKLTKLAIKARINISYQFPEANHQPIWHYDSQTFAEKFNQFFLLAKTNKISFE